MLNQEERWGWETALYNLDQPVLLGKAADAGDGPIYETAETAYEQGLRRGAIEVIARLLGYPDNLNQVWGSAPLTIERGKYGRYEREEPNNGY